MAPPTAQQISDVTAALDGLIDALEEHDQWKNQPKPHATLLYVWDFVNRSKYMLSEYENIRTGNPLQHPEQFRPAPGKGDRAALKVFDEVCGRTMMLKMIIEDTTGKSAIMTGTAGPPVDFGPNVKAKLQELDETVPEDHLMAGLMG